MADKNIRSHAIGRRLFARLALQVGACLFREVCGGLADTDWPVGGAGFEPLHLGLQLAQDSQPGREDSNLCILESGSQLGARTQTCVSRIAGAPAALSKNVAGV